MSLKKYFQLLEQNNNPEQNPEKKCSKHADKKMILSDRLRNLFITIQNIKQSNVSKRFLAFEDPSNTQLFDLSYVDIDDEGENITYLQSGRIDRLIREGKPEEEFWNSKMRMTTKLGRFIKQIFPKFSDEAVQTFGKKVKTIINGAKEEGNFELVDGDDIVYWYDYRNYENTSGILGASYMSGPQAGKFLNIYRKNPNQCKLLILKSSPEKIKGRALVWKLSNPEEKIFMDRVYTNNEDDEKIFVNYARKQGWMQKEKQVYGDSEITIPGEGPKRIVLEVVLDNTNFNLYPYVDTFRYFYPDTKTLKNAPVGKENYYTLTDTEGHYEEWKSGGEDDDPMVYDAYNKKEIPERRATWCKYDNAYCDSEDVIRLDYNGEYAVPESPNIVWSEYKKKWYAKVDCVFSKPLNSWLWDKFAVDVYHDKHRTQPPDKTHRFELNKTIGKIGEYYYDIDILYVKSIKQKPIPLKVGKVETEVTYGFK